MARKKKQSTEYQHYMSTHDGTLLCAGVTRHDHINRSVAEDIARLWETWRREYIASQRNRDFPLARQAHLRVARITIFLVGAPDKHEDFILPENIDASV